MDFVKTEEAKVATLGSKERMAAHYDDESRLNELIALCEDLRGIATGNDSSKRAQLLSERKDVLARGDELASASKELSPLLKSPFKAATAEWAEVRKLVSAL